jgi:hypothetical protein
MSGFFSYRRKDKKAAAETHRVRDQSWSRVDQLWFPQGTWVSRAHEVIHGPSAQLYPDGQLSRLQIFRHGRASQSHFRLELQLGVPEGTVMSEGVVCTFSYGWEEVRTCFEGEAELFGEPAVWDEWARKWIMQICAGERVHLSASF